MNAPVVTAATGIDATDWRDAVRRAAALLVDAGAATAGYPAACVETVEEHGPYIVIAPGLALAHARPERGARQAGIAVARLAGAVPFGHPDNDPVDLVIAFTAVDDGAHVAMLAGVAQQLRDGLATRLRKAADAEQLRAMVVATS